MPLQKSFSEQHRFSRRPQWQKSKSYSGTGPSLDAQHRQPAPAPPVPVSEKTKNKLHQFQFLPQAPAPQALAERVGDAGNAQESPLGPVSREGDVDGTNKENRAGSVASDVRVSDGSKLDSWQDFLGETHPPREEDEDVSPADRILWRHDHNAIASTIIPMISRKRARSSSPLSSSSPSSSSRSKRHQQQPATPSVNVKKLSAALKTPRADPALELWDRYAIPAAAAATAAADDQAASPLGPRGGNHNNYRNNNHNNNNTTTATITANNNNQHHHPPSLAHLMISSSPRVPDKNGGGSLRRSFSCGTHWPKRRKIERPGQLSSVNSQGSPRGHSKASMLSELLVAVTGEIKKSDAAVAAAAAAEEPTSPARNRGTPSGSPARVSDYGDDDLDDDTLLELDAHLPTFQDDEETTFLAETEDHVQEDHRPDDHQDQPAVAKRAAEAEGTLPQEESRREAPPAANSDDDDPYGDAFGQDFDFDAAELAATQQMAKAPRPSPSLSSQVVRTAP
ncbi:hypothetical protein VTK73DRAFT_9839 [Phialemonium thermophilum]|uniref:Uncharacterized protein n=1 Tax=Phialemonium thermophilum TaxID=223376 RepID=A0ABR3W092_9PEZI